MHFGENQLSRSLIGLSPLTTGHPPPFQRWWVRPSTRSYPRFSLPMARSPRFGSRTRDYNALFRLAFATATPPGLTSPHATNSQAHSSKGTPSPPPPKGGVRLRRIVGKRFQVLFHSPPGVLFTFPSRYSSAIGHEVVFSLTRWSWQIHSRFLESAATREHPQKMCSFRVPDYHRLRCRFPTASTNHTLCNSSATCQHGPDGPTTPTAQPLTGITRHRFRLPPLSLATTH